MKQSFRIHVESYAGDKADERPTAFVWKDRLIEVREVVDRWYGEDGDYFKVTGDDGKRRFWPWQHPTILGESLPT